MSKTFWDRFAFAYERVQTCGKPAKAFHQTLESKVASQITGGMDVLELAMGPAMLTEAIAKRCRQLYATDFSKKMVQQAQKKRLPKNTIVEQADATNLQYASDSFDAVVIANALHIMPEPDRAITEIKRVLRTGGILIAPTYTLKDVTAHSKMKLLRALGFRTYSPWNNATYRAFLMEQGLEILHSEVIMWSYFPESFVVCKAA